MHRATDPHQAGRAMTHGPRPNRETCCVAAFFGSAHSAFGWPEANGGISAFGREIPLRHRWPTYD